MARTTTSSGTGRGSAKKAAGAGSSRTTKAAPRKSSTGSGAGSGSGGSSTNGAADALIKLLESPLVAELLALGASAALASFTAQRFRSADDGKSTRRAMKAAVKAAGSAMGARLATEVDEIKKAATKRREEA